MRHPGLKQCPITGVGYIDRPFDPISATAHQGNTAMPYTRTPARKPASLMVEMKTTLGLKTESEVWARLSTISEDVCERLRAATDDRLSSRSFSHYVGDAWSIGLIWGADELGVAMPQAFINADQVLDINALTEKLIDCAVTLGFKRDGVEPVCEVAEKEPATPAFR
jgi:hypothetical protein